MGNKITRTSITIEDQDGDKLTVLSADDDLRACYPGAVAMIKTDRRRAVGSGVTMIVLDRNGADAIVEALCAMAWAEAPDA